MPTLTLEHALRLERALLVTLNWRIPATPFGDMSYQRYANALFRAADEQGDAPMVAPVMLADFD